MADNTPLYNLKAVINEVGLSPATLRAWERRYGLLKPVRSPGGHRLYSRQDIEMLKWLVERQKEGLSISRAVDLWNLTDENERILHRQIPAPPAIQNTTEHILDELRNQWLTACQRFDDQAANMVLDQAFSIAAPDTICIEILQKGLAEMGGRWYAGSASVQQEHFASSIAMQRLDALQAAVTPPTRPGSILAACPPGEEHDFVLLLTTYMLRRHGWEVVYLGANVPLDDLDATLAATSPVMVISAAQTLASAASLRKMSEYLASRGMPLAFGGGIFIQLPAAVQQISGYYLGTEIASVPQMMEHLVKTTLAVPKAQSVSQQYSQVLSRFMQAQAHILDHVISAVPPDSIKPAYLEKANAHFSRSIVSALELGDINYLDVSATWLKVLLSNYGLPASSAEKYYEAYHQAIVLHLGHEGALIEDWFTKQISASMGKP